MKLPTLAQWKQFFKILSVKEKTLFLFFALLSFSSAIALAAVFYQKHTLVVPSETGVYSEGAVGRPRFLNPVYAISYSVDRDITQLLYAGLLEYDRQGKITGGLADYKISEDAKTYEFFLKDKLFWSDGTPITADDAIYTIKIIQDPEYKSPLRPQWIGVETEKISETAFRLKLKTPYAAFLENCTLKIIPRHAWEKNNSENFPLSPLNLNPVVSGPYAVKKINFGKSDVLSSVDLERNPLFYGQKANLRRITFIFFENYSEIESAFKRGKIQGFVPEENFASGRLSGANYLSYTLPRYFAIFFNHKNNKAFEDEAVKTALSYATDRQEILAAALNNKGKIVNSPLSPEIYQNPSPSLVYSYDPQKAAQILDDAGYKQGTDGRRAKNVNRQPAFQFTKTLTKGTRLQNDVKELQKCLAREIMPDLETNGNFGDKTVEAVKLFQEKYRSAILDPQNIEKPNGEVKLATREKLNEICFPSGNVATPLEIILTVADEKPFTDVAQKIKEQWGKIGINVNINALAISAIERESVKPRSYEALLFGQAMGMIPDPYPFWHSTQTVDPGLNFSLYENKDADKLLEEIRGLSDQNARNGKISSFQDLIAKNPPAVFLYNPDYSYVLSDSVKGIKNGVITDPSRRFADISEWYTATKRIWK